jgi:hypothetical protein
VVNLSLHIEHLGKTLDKAFHRTRHPKHICPSMAHIVEVTYQHSAAQDTRDEAD